ncbi:MAG: queuosine precursor transporter [Candidatus Buchananbacteria bacterium]
MKKLDLQDKIFLLFGIFIGALLSANFLGAKITAFSLPLILAWILNIIFWPLIFLINLIAAVLPAYTVFGQPFLLYNFFDVIHVSVAILTVPIMFLVNDIISEVAGKPVAHKLINLALIVMLVTLVITVISVWLPADPSRQYFSQQAYADIFGVSLRMTVASIIAFILAQKHDVWAFNFWRKKTNGKWLWLRNNASNFSSEFVDSTVFMFIAFYGLSPKFNAVYIFSLIIPYWIFKILFSLIQTPFCYLGVKWLKK